MWLGIAVVAAAMLVFGALASNPRSGEE